MKVIIYGKGKDFHVIDVDDPDELINIIKSYPYKRLIITW